MQINQKCFYFHVAKKQQVMLQCRKNERKIYLRLNLYDRLSHLKTYLSSSHIGSSTRTCTLPAPEALLMLEVLSIFEAQPTYRNLPIFETLRTYKIHHTFEILLISRLFSYLRPHSHARFFPYSKLLAREILPIALIIKYLDYQTLRSLAEIKTIRKSQKCQTQ